ncbi:Nucleoporin AMO1 [Cyberlindnera fabianii]|uniref:Nucleoporin AMO1 n=1 Tax=Cyberlindnera fabianii TaxID=36022 RepID=A0A1V2L515_CYBFA|nr:Nucleoporin AMO1 [Cyberlindnera fabianii]
MSGRKPPCKFFQQGPSFGGGRNSGDSLKKEVERFASSTALDSRDKELVDAISQAKDIEVFPLSSSMGFGFPATENLIIGRDYSFEESRWDYLQAQQQNAIPQYEQMISIRDRDTKQCLEELKRDSRKAARYSQITAQQKLKDPTQVVKPFLSRPLDLSGNNLTQQTNASPFGSTSNAFGSTSSSSFGASTNSTQNPFGGQTQTTSPFGQSSLSGSTGGAFGNQTIGNGTNSSSSGFGSSSFGAAPKAPAFGASSLGSNPNTGSAFGSTAFGSSGFGSSGLSGTTTAPSAPATSAFGQSGFGSNAPANTTSAFGSASLGQNTSSTPAFGSSGFGSSSFGAKPTTTPAFGSSGFGSSTSNSSPFGSLGQKPAASPFGQTSTTNGSPFGQSGSNSSPFGGATSSTSTTTPAFGQSAFGSTAQPAALASSASSTSTSAFGSTNTPFGQASTQPSAFGKSTFGQPSSASPFGQSSTTSPFGQTSSTSPFGQSAQQSQAGSTAFSTNSFGSGFNSGPQNNSNNTPTGNFIPTLKQSAQDHERVKKDDLSDVVKKQFEATEFTLGSIPEIEPPLVYC